MKITGFSQAHFDKGTKTGYLAYYYPYDAVKDQQMSSETWRNGSYSPEILNFKEGHASALERFKTPFIELIKEVLRIYGKNKARVVPVPSSIATEDPNFKHTPRQKGEKRNRDDRTLAFCNLLASADTQIEVRNFLIRMNSKTEKETWTAEQHAVSMEFASEYNPKADFSGLFILVDDVITNGGTMEGARQVLAATYPKAIIAKLAIGLSKSPHEFKPL